jgi:hypothetical protein
MNYPYNLWLVWGTLALINAGLAQSKRRSGLAWFFVSLALGPIATFIIVVTDPPTPPRGSQNP